MSNPPEISPESQTSLAELRRMLLRTVGDSLPKMSAETLIPDHTDPAASPSAPPLPRPAPGTKAEESGDAERRDAAGSSSFCPWRFVVSRFWRPAELDGRFVEVTDYAMQPLILPGAFVGYSAADENPDALEGKLVVAWIEGRPVVRWLHRWGRFAVLRAQTESMSQVSELIDLDRLGAEGPIRRVLWVSIPQ